MTGQCDRCRKHVGGGQANLARHQRSLTCRMTDILLKNGQARDKRKKRKHGDLETPRPPAEQSLNSDEAFPLDDEPDDPPDFTTETVDEEVNLDVFAASVECIPDASFETLGCRNVDFTEEGLDELGPMARAALRFAAIIEARASRRERTVRGLQGESLEDQESTQEGGAMADDQHETEICDPEDSTTGLSSAEQDLVGHILQFVAPSKTKNAGLSAEQRKQLFSLVDVCLSVASKPGEVPQTVVDLIRRSLGRETTCSNADRLLELLMDDMCEDDGWVEKKFTVSTGHCAIGRWNSNVISALVGVVKDYWNVLGRVSTYDGQNFGHPTSGLHMAEFESMVKKQLAKRRERWDSERDFVLLLVYFSDATLLVNKGSLSAHPVTLSVANLPPRESAESQILLGFLSDFDKTAFENEKHRSVSMRQDDGAQVRRALVATQTAAMVESLVVASYEGIDFEHPPGTKRRMFPTLFSAPLDHPEICTHLGVKNSYCGMCFWKCPDRQRKSMYRSETETRQVVDGINVAPKASIADLKDAYGVHGQRSGLWGFNGSCPSSRLPPQLTPSTKKSVQETYSVSPYTDIHVAVSGEVMHEVDLGILVYTKDTVLRYLSGTLGWPDGQIERLNEGLRLAMSVESRCQGVSHPPTKKVTSTLQGYFGGISRIEASEHRAVIQFVVPVLYRFLGKNDTITRLVALVVKYYRTRQRHNFLPKAENSHTLESLDRVNFLFDEVETRLKTMGNASADSEVTPKLHQQRHYRMQVIREGNTAITSGQSGEANNAKIKSGVRAGRTNMQKDKVVATLVKLYRRSAATSTWDGSTSFAPNGNLSKKYETAEVIALRTDRCAFTKHRNVRPGDRFNTTEIYDWAKSYVGSENRPRSMCQWDTTVSDFRRDLIKDANTTLREESSTVAEKSDVHARLEILLSHPTIGYALLEELSHFFCNSSIEGVREYGFSMTLKVVKSAVCPSVPYDDRDTSTLRILQRLRANPQFYGKPWFDFVAIQGAHTDMGDERWYGRLILLFHIADPKTGNWAQMAFIRYMRRKETKQDQDHRMSQSDDEPNVTELKYATRVKKGIQKWYFGVCLAESIVRKVSVVAGNEAGSDSLLYSLGEPEFFDTEKKAVFLLNENIWETGSYKPYRHNVEVDLNISDASTPD